MREPSPSVCSRKSCGRRREGPCRCRLKTGTRSERGYRLDRAVAHRCPGPGQKANSVIVVVIFMGAATVAALHQTRLDDRALRLHDPARACGVAASAPPRSRFACAQREAISGRVRRPARLRGQLNDGASRRRPGAPPHAGAGRSGPSCNGRMGYAPGRGKQGAGGGRWSRPPQGDTMCRARMAIDGWGLAPTRAGPPERGAGKR